MDIKSGRKNKHQPKITTGLDMQPWKICELTFDNLPYYSQGHIFSGSVTSSKITN